jgi:hypothetical protein
MMFYGGGSEDIPLYVTNCFSLAVFKILLLSLFFDNLIMMCLSIDFLGYLFGDFRASQISRFGKFSDIII